LALEAARDASFGTLGHALARGSADAAAVAKGGWRKAVFEGATGGLATGALGAGIDRVGSVFFKTNRRAEGAEQRRRENPARDGCAQVRLAHEDPFRSVPEPQRTARSDDYKYDIARWTLKLPRKQGKLATSRCRIDLHRIDHQRRSSRP